MTLEERLRDALHAAAHSADPSSESSDPRRAGARMTGPPSAVQRVAIIVGALGLSALTIAMLVAAFGGRDDRLNSPVGDGSPAVSSVLRVRCEQGSAIVLTPVVEAQPDGVHVLVDSDDGSSHVVVRPEPDQADTPRWSSGSNGLDDEFVQEYGPGNYRIRCFTSTGESQRDDPSLYDGAFQVVAAETGQSESPLTPPLSGTRASTQTLGGSDG